MKKYTVDLKIEDLRSMVENAQHDFYLAKMLDYKTAGEKSHPVIKWLARFMKGNGSTVSLSLLRLDDDKSTGWDIARFVFTESSTATQFRLAWAGKSTAPEYLKNDNTKITD